MQRPCGGKGWCPGLVWLGPVGPDQVRTSSALQKVLDFLLRMTGRCSQRSPSSLNSKARLPLPFHTVPPTSCFSSHRRDRTMAVASLESLPKVTEWAE